MQVTRNRAPNQRGVKRLLDQHSAKSVCARYHDDEQRQKLSTTLKREIIGFSWALSFMLVALCINQAVVQSTLFNICTPEGVPGRTLTSTRN